MAALGAGAVGVLAAGYLLDQKYYISKDIALGRKLLPLLSRSKQLEPEKALLWHRLFKENATKFPDKEALYFVDEKRGLTWSEVDRRSTQIANWLLAQGCVPGDVVALYSGNCPEYVVLWLAGCKIDVKFALINYNLKQKTLMHCLKLSKAKLIITRADIAGAVEELMSEINVPVWSFSGDTGFCPCMDGPVSSTTTEEVDPALTANVGGLTTCFFIYTSGTTGMPKAAVCAHSKSVMSGGAFVGAFSLTSEDRIYSSLPLYHSAGGLVGVGMAAATGATLCVRSKFSATNFFKDVAETRATVTQYIGELCRYLLTTKESPHDKAHNLRIAIGNGLRPEIWTDFCDRFNIPEIGEFYGATEGNVAFFHHYKHSDPNRKPGAIGHMGLIMRMLLGTKIVKFDVETEEPIRGPDGFCIECAPGEPGEAIGPIIPGDPSKQFYGYKDNEEANAKKTFKNVFKKDDIYFRTGDLLSMDDHGYIYFIDRIGDTFRWKSENVSTMEVSEVVSVCKGIQECNVVGVQLPKKDGRAPMAAITPLPGASLDFDEILSTCKKELPSYAVPLFIRIVEAMEITGTFKHRKVEFKKQGVDPSAVSDRLYWLNPDSARYEPFGPEEWQRVVGGTAKI